MQIMLMIFSLLNVILLFFHNSAFYLENNFLVYESINEKTESSIQFLKKKKVSINLISLFCNIVIESNQMYFYIALFFCFLNAQDMFKK